MTLTDAHRTAADRRRLLDELRRCQVDVDAARQRVESIVDRRRRRRRLVGVSSAVVAVVLVGAAAFALGGEDPDDVVADRVETTSTLATSTSTTQAPAEEVAPEVVVDMPAPTPVDTTVPVVPVGPGAAPVPAPVDAPASTTTTTPGAANQPMQAQLDVLTPRVSAGSTTVLRVSWADRDHAGERPSYTVDWGDPAVAAATGDAPPSGACREPGAPASSSDRLEFRHATPGRHVVRVVVSTCGGDGPFAERVELEGVVEVVAPELAGGPGIAVVLHRDPDDLRLLLPALDAADARLLSQGPPQLVSELGPRAPVLSQRVGAAPATVVVLPRGAIGVVSLGWPSTSCTASASVDLAGASGSGPAPTAVLAARC